MSVGPWSITTGVPSARARWPGPLSVEITTSASCKTSMSSSSEVWPHRFDVVIPALDRAWLTIEASESPMMVNCPERSWSSWPNLAQFFTGHRLASPCEDPGCSTTWGLCSATNSVVLERLERTFHCGSVLATTRVASTASWGPPFFRCPGIGSSKLRTGASFW